MDYPQIVTLLSTISSLKLVEKVEASVVEHFALGVILDDSLYLLPRTVTFAPVTKVADDQFLKHLDAVFGKAVFKFLLGSNGYWRFSGDYLENLDLDFISDKIPAGKSAPLKPDKVS
ncbi:hypothetical protein RclHR1_02290002 [Rhizophagus clarus]|uniref:Uncharacterized protein n=1 Tax=Rhizophagus clarus TaxID=94130 RepID=A0A2Z6RP93_9GLOM|nr:hypothetical protein RclHR1_02290002 [Rhizophagus clarus]